MKKVILGKLYDTETAEYIGSYQYSKPNDFEYEREVLYKKKTGEYFLYGEGGPKSKYVKVVGQNEWSGGEKIIPMDVESAKEWAEEHLDGDAYIAAFGDVEE